jgi:hypothetical protein
MLNYSRRGVGDNCIVGLVILLLVYTIVILGLACVFTPFVLTMFFLIILGIFVLVGITNCLNEKGNKNEQK